MVTHCAGRVSANIRPHQLRWGDRKMGTAILYDNQGTHSALRSSEVPVILYCVNLGLEECGSLIAREYILLYLQNNK